MRKLLFLTAIPFTLLITGCAHWISEPSRALADRNITFRELRESPDAYRGKNVMLGGIVTAFVRTKEGTQLEVEEHRLDSRELPDESIPSRGRFLATTPNALDPDEYAPGSLVSLMGVVEGEKTLARAGREHAYPVIAVKELHAIVIEQEMKWGAFGGF